MERVKLKKPRPWAGPVYCGKACRRKSEASHHDINDALAMSTAEEIAQKYDVETIAIKHDVASEESTTGAFICTKLVSKQTLKQNSGSIVNIASVSGLLGNIGQANYSASKAGLIGLTKTTARELAERGVNVNAIAPGFIQSDMTHVLSEEVSQRLLSQIPMNQYGKSEDVANIILFFSLRFGEIRNRTSYQC